MNRRTKKILTKVDPGLQLAVYLMASFTFVIGLNLMPKESTPEVPTVTIEEALFLPEEYEECEQPSVVMLPEPTKQKSETPFWRFYQLPL